jgi:hypothetical protein
MPLLRGEHVEEEGTSTREVTVVMLHLRDDFALPLKPPTAFGYKPFSFGKTLPLALSGRYTERRQEFPIAFAACAPLYRVCCRCML